MAEVTCNKRTEFHLIAGASWYACMLSPGHEGKCKPGGNCVAHGPYVCDGYPVQCPKWPDCVKDQLAKLRPRILTGPGGERWNKGCYDDGAEARIVANAPISACPSVDTIGQYAADSWRAGWQDADADLRKNPTPAVAEEKQPEPARSLRPFADSLKAVADSVAFMIITRRDKREMSTNDAALEIESAFKVLLSAYAPQLLQTGAASPHARDGVPGPARCVNCGSDELVFCYGEPHRPIVGCKKCGEDVRLKTPSDFARFFPAPSLRAASCEKHPFGRLPEGKGLWEVPHGGCEYPHGGCTCYCGASCPKPAPSPEEMAGRIAEAVVLAFVTRQSMTQEEVKSLVLSVLRGEEKGGGAAKEGK